MSRIADRSKAQQLKRDKEIALRKQKPIELSVCIPLFRARYCAWLAFEGLCRQTDIDFNWELIMAEEVGDEDFTEAEVMKYKARLEKVGCVKLKYIPIKKWMPLSLSLIHI